MDSTLTRRALGGLVLGSVVAAIAGCSEERPPQDVRAWLASLDGVAKVDVLTQPDGAGDEVLVLRLRPGLPDAAVRTLVGQVREGFDERNPDRRFETTVRLQIDAFAASFFADPVQRTSTTLERALWLRRDGRATRAAYVGGYDTWTVTAPATAVAIVAAAVAPLGDPESRPWFEVRSPDGQSGVQVGSGGRPGDASQLGAVRRMAELQRTYPRLTGWLRDNEGALWFHPGDIPLATLRARLPEVVGRSSFGALEIGWGPARAAADDFTEAFAPGALARGPLDRLAKEPGVEAVKAGPSPTEEPSMRVQVTTRAGFLAATRATAGIDDFVPVEVLGPAPPRLLGFERERRMSTSNRARPQEVTAFAAAIDVASVVNYGLTIYRGRIAFSPKATDAELDTVLRPLATFRDDEGRPLSMSVLAATGDGFFSPVATIDGRSLTIDAAPAQRAFANRVAASWRRVGGSA